MGPIATAPLRLTVSEENQSTPRCAMPSTRSPRQSRPATGQLLLGDLVHPPHPDLPNPVPCAMVGSWSVWRVLCRTALLFPPVSTHTLRYELRFPQGAERVWEAVATREGLPGWLAVAEPFVRHEGGVITLRWQNTDEHGNATVAPGRVTGWGPVRLAEYTVDVHGRMRFDLRDEGSEGTRLRFTNEFTGSAASRLDCLAGWHHHFEFLADALDGRPKDWSTWNLDRWRELRADYAAAGQ
ncbi:hypothetical protein SRIMM317S_05369 [Streptomyces rimosus subsp. rimosus]